MTREDLLLEQVRAWAAEGRIPDPGRWLESHGLAVLLPDLYGDERARYWARQTLAANLLFLEETRRIVGVLLAQDVGVVALKGIDLLERLYAGRESRRRLSDIDLLVDHRKIDLALALVGGLGYRHEAEESQEAQQRWSKDVTLAGPNGVRVELHHRMSLEAGFTATREDLRAGGHLDPGAGPGGSDRLSLEALAIHLLVHRAIHRFGGDSLRWVLDVLALLDCSESDLEPSRLLRVARELRARRAAGAAVAAIERLVPAASLGPIDSLRTRDLRERLALRLVDPVRSTLEGRGKWSKPRSVLCRLVLEPGLPSALAFVYRKARIVRDRDPRRLEGA